MPDTNLKFVARPSGGLNLQEFSAEISESELTECTNMLPVVGCLEPRPVLRTNAANIFQGLTERLWYVEYSAGLIGGTGLNVGIALSESGTLYFSYGANIYSPVSGSSPTFVDYLHMNFAIVNGAVLVANASTGIVQFITGADAVDISDAPYRYVIGHLQRAFAAYKLSGGPNDPVTVAWSVQGDATDWTSTTLGAGSAVLSDSADEITGLAIIQNVVVIFHRSQIHIGTPTGQASPAYTFSTFSRERVAGIGCVMSTSLAVRDNVARFVGLDNVYAFDLQNITPIGDKIKSAFYAQLTTARPSSTFPTPYKGFYTSLGWAPGGNRNRNYYHLFPVYATAGAPHWVYSLDDNTWSQHSYAYNTNYPFRKLNTSILGDTTNGYDFYYDSDTAAFVDDADNPPGYYVWDSTGISEGPCTFTSKEIIVGDIVYDYVLERVFLVMRDTTGGLSITCTVTSILNGVVNTLTMTQSVGGAHDGRLKRYWFNGRLVGNVFKISFTFTSPIAQIVPQIGYYGAQFQESSEFRI